jgi:ParB family transcriptional regulator, chromosome partitioning protein
MKTSLLDTVEYKEKIIDVPLSNIDPNSLNPRKRFVDTEEDALIESILSKGLLNPIIVYKRMRDKRYVILDGERRYRAFKKLNRKEISCHVLEKEPTELENLSMMFHLHNVREEWTDFAIAQTLVLIVDEMGKNVRALDRQDKLELVRITSLTIYKIDKYLSFYDYPQSVIHKFMESEMKETPTKGMDPDILAEMHRPIKMIKSEVPAFLKVYNEEKIIDACVRKKAKGIIKTNREFREITKSLKAVKTGRIRNTVMFEKLESFVNELEVTPQNIFEETAEMLFQVESIIKSADKLIKDVQNLDLRELTILEKTNIVLRLERLADVINHKLG